MGTNHVFWWFILTSFVLWLHNSVAEGKPLSGPPKLIVNDDANGDTTIIVRRKVGDTAHLDCSVTGYPQAEIKWYKDGKPFSHRNSTNPVDRSHFRFILFIKDVQIVDRGIYFCNVSNGYGWVNRSFDLQVSWRTDIFDKELRMPKYLPTDKVPPKLLKLHPSREIAVRIGRPFLELDCTASGHPRPVVTWYKDSRPFTHRVDAPRNQSSFILRLKDVEAADSGIYTCYVSNAWGSFNHSVKVFIMKRYQLDRPGQFENHPVVIEEIQNVTALVGQEAALECKVTSDSTFHYMWAKVHPSMNFLDNTTDIRYDVFQEKAPNISSSVKGHYRLQLTFVNVTKADEGRYACLVRNAIEFRDHVIGHLKVRVSSSKNVFKILSH